MLYDDYVMDVRTEHNCFEMHSDDLPWNGRCDLLADPEPQVKWSEDYDDWYLEFYVICDDKSPEPGRIYCVMALLDLDDKIVISNYYSTN